MKGMFSVTTMMFAMLVASVCHATPTLTTPSTSNLSANMATLVLVSSDTGSGYFTLLSGSDAPCGTGSQVKTGLTSSGAAAPYYGSLPLTATTPGYYTIRNLTRSTAYTVCFTADSPTGSNLNATPVKANLTTTAATAIPSPGWGVVGSAGFSAGTATSTSLAFTPDGTPHVAFGDDGVASKVTVMKYTAGAWSPVGSPGFSAGAASSTSLAIAPDGTPHVAYSDYGNSGRATVMKYCGGSWSVVGTAGFSGGVADTTSLAFAPDGSPHVAYSDYASGGKVTVKKFSGGSWINVGMAGFSPFDAGFTTLAMGPDGAPWVAYSDYGNIGKATVMKYGAGIWSVVGSAGFSSGPAGNFSLAFAQDGTPFVSYADDGNSSVATVMKYAGGVWTLVGSGGVSSGMATSTSLAFAPDGTPFISCGDDGSGGRATVMKYSDGDWSVVGTAGFSAGAATATSLGFAPDGTPYVAYGDDGTSSKATVMKLNNIPTIGSTPAATAIVGTEYTFTPTSTYADRFTVTGSLPPGLSFDTATGTLNGTVTTVGIYSNIVITAINSFGSASLPAFSVTVTGTTLLDTTLTSVPANPSPTSSFSFAFTSTEPGATFECSLQGGAYGPCSTPYSGSVVYAQCTTCRAATDATFAVRAKGATATDPTPAAYTWTVNHPLGTPVGSVVDGGIIQLKATEFTGNVSVSRAITFTLKGGYDAGYSANSGVTTIHGAVTISAGTVIFENIAIM